SSTRSTPERPIQEPIRRTANEFRSIAVNYHRKSNSVKAEILFYLKDLAFILCVFDEVGAVFRFLCRMPVSVNK
ncbi:MAG: hypothetical protein ACREQV_08410, partial [Candidatus Binatia bacterium]